jgi:hypothetical protein
MTSDVEPPRLPSDGRQRTVRPPSSCSTLAARSVSSQDVSFIWFDHWQNWQLTLTRSTSKMVGANGGDLYLNPPILANASSRTSANSVRIA